MNTNEDRSARGIFDAAVEFEATEIEILQREDRLDVALLNRRKGPQRARRTITYSSAEDATGVIDRLTTMCKGTDIDLIRMTWVRGNPGDEWPEIFYAGDLGR